MANHTTEGTGVLQLTAATPVIHALFGTFALDPNHPEEGQAYIRKSTDDGYPTWEEIEGGLQTLAESLALVQKGGDSLPMKQLVTMLAAHYGKEASVLDELLEPALDEDADLWTLFQIAQLLDDGHGLVSVEMVSAAYCSRPILGEFGGHGFYIGRGVRAWQSAADVTLVGQKLNEAVLAKDIDASVRILRERLAESLEWITDPEVRLEVAKRLGLPG